MRRMSSTSLVKRVWGPIRAVEPNGVTRSCLSHVCYLRIALIDTEVMHTILLVDLKKTVMHHS